MAITLYYVDPAGGNDTTGDGTIGTPWATVQKALDTITQGTDGDQINLKNGSADVITASLDFSTYGTPTIAAPLVIKGYTSVANDAGKGEISAGGSNILIVNNSSFDFLTLIDLKIGNTGTSSILLLDNACDVHFCEIHTSSNKNVMTFGNNCTFYANYVHTTTYTGTLGGVLNHETALICVKNYFDIGTMKASGILKGGSGKGDCNIDRNIFKANNVDGSAILAQGQRYTITNNSFFNESAGTEYGINYQQNQVTKAVITGNIIEGYSGAGGAAIRSNSGSSDGHAAIVSDNLFFNNTTETTWGGEPPLIERDNTTAIASPFVDAANGDFNATTEAKALGFNPTLGDGTTVSFEDAGAVQREETGGGGSSLIALAY